MDLAQKKMNAELDVLSLLNDIEKLFFWRGTYQSEIKFYMALIDEILEGIALEHSWKSAANPPEKFAKSSDFSEENFLNSRRRLVTGGLLINLRKAALWIPSETCD